MPVYSYRKRVTLIISVYQEGCDSRLKSKSKQALAAMTTVPFIMVLGNSMLIPVMPQIKKVLDLSQFQVSLIITLFSVPAGLAIPFAGFLSDRFGRKKIIVPALLIYGLGGVIASLAALLMQHPYSVILAGRVVQGIGAAGTAPVAMALAGDIFTSQERSKVLGIIESSNGFGKVVSPVLGSLIGLLAWYAAFFVFPVLCIPAAIAMWFLVKEPESAGSQQPIKQYIKSIGIIFKNKAGFLLTAFLTGSVVLMILFGILFYLSDFLETRYSLFNTRKGLVLAVPVLAMSMTSFITGHFIQKKIGLMKILVVTGLALITVSLLINPFFPNIYLFVGTMVFTGIGVGLVLPCLNTLITSSASTDERGMVTSLYGGVRFLGVAVGPPLFGWLMDIRPLVMFWSAAGAAIFTGVLTVLLLPANKNKNDKENGNTGQPIKNTISPLAARKPLPRKDVTSDEQDEKNRPRT